MLCTLKSGKLVFQVTGWRNQYLLEPRIQIIDPMSWTGSRANAFILQMRMLKSSDMKTPIKGIQLVIGKAGLELRTPSSQTSVLYAKQVRIKLRMYNTILSIREQEYMCQECYWHRTLGELKQEVGQLGQSIAGVQVKTLATRKL